MIDISLLHIGSKVHYQPEHYDDNEWENGMVKEIRPETINAVWVVYHCAGKWHRYYNYTSARTQLSDLFHGWR